MDEQGEGKVQSIGTAASPAPDMAAQAQAQNQAILEDVYKAVRSGGSWFYWIAGLSIVGTLITLFGGKFWFAIGLGATQIMDGVIQEIGTKAAIIALPINLIIAGIYVVFGYLSCQRLRWAFVVGMVLYGLDGLLMILGESWLGLALHAYVLYAISRGLKAVEVARDLEAKMRVYGPR